MLPPPPRIGNVQLESPLLLAPLSGRTDVAFRIGARRLGGIGLAFTDLISPHGVLRRNLRTAQILATCEEDRPLAVQIYGANAEVMAEAARHLEGELAPAIIDINMGCPIWKVTRKGGGSALLADPDKAARLAERIVGAVKTPVTVKLRLGREAGKETAPQIARLAASCGVAAITIHGRTAGQRYSGPVDMEGIRRTVEAAPEIPVFANGDVTSFESAQATLSATGAAGLAIGRAALSNPWIFSQILARDRGEAPPEPSRTERIEFMRGHFRRLVELRGVLHGCRQFRKWVRHYGSSLELTRARRDRFMRLSAPEELATLAGELLEGTGD